MSDTNDPRVPLKAMVWEEAKGKLRALAAIQGSYSSIAGFTEIWQQLDLKVEGFIKDIEDEGLHE